jgi:hypothetical protein
MGHQVCETNSVELTDIKPEDRQWVLENEARWRRAHELAAAHPRLDVGDFYHVLCTINETPSERVRRSLRHARLRTRTG